MRKRTEIAIWGTVVVASLGLHAVAFGGLGGRQGIDGFGKPKMKPATFVDVSIPKPKEVPPPPAPPPPPKAEKAPKLAMAHPTRVKAAPPPSAPQPSAPPPADESPADFSGVTMTNDAPGAAGWTSATGNGQAMHGAVGRPGARVTHRNVEGSGQQLVRNPGPPLVAAADLSRPPAPPELADAVKQAYPADARAKGIPGKAVVRLRIAPDGRTSDIKVVSESAASFGEACQSVLRGSRWSPPVDRRGQAVATVVNFTCRFEVQ
ncbi:MAG TPA: energy transducer TonB [Polyangia bacterium]|jgi:TonB family protein|nr:energy transducer TonB [Polyangia bacterium]